MRPDNNQYDSPEGYFRKFDLNCDLAQGWGVYRQHDEEALLPFVSSVNISCGAHAGDPPLILNALKLAKEKGLAVGAQVGFPDIAGFGRREMRLEFDELNAYVTSQLGLLAGMASSMGVTLTHFRPHSAMYYKCITDTVFAEQLAKIVSKFSSWLIFVAPAGSYLNLVSDVSGLRTAGEVHLDQFYRRDGSIQRQTPNRNISFDFCMAQARSLIFQGKLIVEGGRRNRVPFRTIHLSMERPYAVELAEAVCKMMKEGPQSMDGIAGVENLQPIKDLQSKEALSEAWIDR
jgi:UPF0271 protein